MLYFNKNSNRITRSGDSEQKSRQYTLLKSQVNQAQDIIQEYQGLNLHDDKEVDEV